MISRRPRALPVLVAVSALVSCSAPATGPVPPPAIEAALPSAAVASASVQAPAVPASAVPVAPPSRPTEKIDAVSLAFELPSEAWKRHPGLGAPPAGVTQLGFERDDVLDDSGHAVRPYCGFTTEPVPAQNRDIIQYSLSWRLRVPFHVDAVFSHEDGTIQLKNAIGYRGTKAYGGDEHTLFIVHGLFRDRGYVVVCDTTTSVLPKVQGEIEALLKSMKHTEEP